MAVKKNFKYNINKQISLLPRNISIMAIVDLLEKEGITQATFYRDKNLPSGSETSIPSDRLQKYAKLFECSIDDLLTNEVKTKSIRQQLLPKGESKNRKIKNGLS